MGDLPARTGLGSSSSFISPGSLLHALYAIQAQGGQPGAPGARGVLHSEIERLREPIGKQDQYIAAYGGLQFIQFNPDGTVFVDPVIISPETRIGIEPAPVDVLHW